MTKKTPLTFRCDRDSAGVYVHQYERTIPNVCLTFGLEIITGTNACAPADGYYKTPWCRFEVYSLAFLREGRGLFQIRGEPEQEVLPGDLIVITPGVVHHYGGAFHQCFWEETLLFSGRMADDLVAAGVLKSGKYSGFSSGLFKEILTLSANLSPSSQIEANFKLLEFLSVLYKNGITQEADQLEQIRELIENHPERWWTVKELAERSRYSPNQFRFHFRKRTGLTPKHYIEEFKLRYAARLLLNDPKLSVADVARKTGYQDEYHFSRRFKLLFSAAPGRYRQMLRAGELKYGDFVQNENREL